MSTTFYPNWLTKEAALAIYGTPKALAEALGIERANVYMWKAGQPIPQKHDLKIRYVLKPELFKAA